MERAQQQRAYASDSEGAPSTSATGTVPRGVTKSRKDMRGSTDLYTEIRPSILSAERVTITQHSGIHSAARNMQLIFWEVSYIMCAPRVVLYAIWNLHARRNQREVRLGPAYLLHPYKITHIHKPRRADRKQGPATSAI